MDQRKFNALAFERTGVDDLSVVCEYYRTAQGDITQHLIARGNDALNGVPPRGRRGRFNFLAEANSPNRRCGQIYAPWRKR